MFIQLGAGKLDYKRLGHCSQIQGVIIKDPDNSSDKPSFAFIFEF